MAAPDDLSIKSLNNTTWAANKTLSGDSDAVLTLQGVHYLLRTILGAAQITVGIKQWDDPTTGTTHLEMENNIAYAYGLPGVTDTYVTDFSPKEYYDTIFGNVRDRARWVRVNELRDAFQKEAWAEETEVLELWTDHLDVGASTSQVCGFEVVEGERRYTRRLVVSKGEDVLRVRLVFDYVGQRQGDDSEEVEGESVGASTNTQELEA
ncbi:hypothetical protein PRZ48_009195 [Zasmidium cellare]|uniref:Uncharacterized protein n=1 Tax=Zasmidium cellare TaxID=395010 RepID=A0ABR0EBM5_ZASCE|nr:hypothetical protein PRZ48_009195 [Zasmidium cellare]